MFISFRQMVVLLLITFLYAGALWQESQQQDSSTETISPKNNLVFDDKAKQSENNRDIEQQQDLQELVDDTKDPSKLKEMGYQKIPVSQQNTKEMAPNKAIFQAYHEYVIQETDTLWSIARKFYPENNSERIKARIDLICKANPDLSARKLSIGKRILIPITELKVVSPKRRREKILQQAKMQQHKLPLLHRIAMGDTLYTLALFYYRDEKEWLSILKANPNIDPCKLEEGTQLNIPLCQGK